MRKTIFLAAILSIVGLLSCGPSETKQETASAASPASSAGKYTLVLLKTGPKSGQLSEGANSEAFAGHFSNMIRMAQEHKLVLAGPYGEKKHDPLLRGLFVINSDQRSQATEWASTDPTTRAGVFELEYHDFKTDAPLVAMLDAVLARDEKAKAEGRTPSPGDGARSYVILNSSQGDVAQSRLKAVGSAGGVLLIARVDDYQVFAVLDAKNVAEAQEKFASVLDSIGDCQLDDWYATDILAKQSER
ncbi:MAG TPA: hypothetical protein VK843_16970 [Planctomycetota bacterium]|nr:hypothetical protein [Planctomycetota bacterium]